MLQYAGVYTVYYFVVRRIYNVLLDSEAIGMNTVYR